MSIYLILFLEFFKIGLFAVGGGITTLPFLYELAQKYSWLTPETLSDIIAVSESTPGPLGVNMATYAGYYAAGILGGIISTLSLALPSFLVVLIVCKLLSKFSENKYVQNGLAGLRPATVGLVFLAWLSIVKTGLIDMSKYTVLSEFYKIFDLKSLIFALILLPFLVKFKWHPLVFVATGAVVGIVFKL